MKKIWVYTKRGDYQEQIEIEVPEPRTVVSGPWGRYVKLYNLPVAVYNENTKKLIEVVSRTGTYTSAFGQFSVWKFSYKGKKYTSMLDDIYGYASISV